MRRAKYKPVAFLSNATQLFINLEMCTVWESANGLLGNTAMNICVWKTIFNNGFYLMTI